jgi:hypothetical protein
MITWLLQHRNGKWAINRAEKRDYVSSITLAALINRYSTRAAARADRFPWETPVKVEIDVEKA